MTLAKRIKEAMDGRGLSPAELSRATKITQGGVSQWLDGTTKSLKAATASKIEAATGYSANWIATGQLPKKPAPSAGSNVVPAVLGGVRIPVINFVQAGTWSAVIDGAHHGNAEDWLTTDQQLSRSAFALEIKGESMMPEFRPGDRVIIDPEVLPLPGDFVVAKNGEEEATFKKYRPRGTDAQGSAVFELVPLNDDFATIRSSETPTRIVGTMVEHRKYRRAK